MPDTFDIRGIKGLMPAEAAMRLSRDGFNELPSSRRRGNLGIIAGVIREPMFLLLLACGTVYLVLGEPREAAMLLGFVLVVMGITIVQERRTERALEALRDLSSPRALVIRGGTQMRIPGRDVVRGDMVILVEGDRVPADAILRQTINLSADESLLTGESVPVRKRASPDASELPPPGGEDLPGVFAGTLVTAGEGLAEVVSTGLDTEMGKIGRALERLTTEKTLLQKETGRLVRSLAMAGLAMCTVVVVAYALTRGNTYDAWVRGLLAGLATAMAILPEEFPVVMTIFLALGAWRISRSNVLTRRIPAIETLGAATVLCVDKTGTLTQNRMSVRKLFANSAVYDAAGSPGEPLPEQYHRLVEFGILASRKDPFDPMEKALRELGLQHLAKTEHLHENWRLVREYPLSPELLALSHVWRSPDGRGIMVAAKGAPEAIADLCHLDPEQTGHLQRHVDSLASDGLRVLGVARGNPVGKAPLPHQQHDFEFTFLGLVALADPIRPSVPQAIAECSRAGVRVVMITGDNPVTALSIAGQIGLPHADDVVTGGELDKLSDEELRRRVSRCGVIARAVPQQKLRIVSAMKSDGQVVAMTGDGVNDAPALKAAHIGIAMGSRGTDVARESADLVLLDDDFASIVQAIRLGRRIFDNIRKAVSYIFAVHVPIAGLSLIPVFFGDWPLILLPMHIVFLELIIDPACTLVFEAEPPEPDVMTRRPRAGGERLFGLRSLWVSLLQGASVLAIVMAVFLVARTRHDEDTARALTFATLVVANLGLIMTNRSWVRTIAATLREPNAALWWVTGGAAGFLAMVLYLPPLRAMFHFGVLHANDLAICMLAGAMSVAWFEGLKIVRRRHSRRGGERG